MTGPLAGACAIVTGGGSGIGEGICHGLAAAGARVLVVDIERERAERVAQDVGSAAMAAQADVTRASDVAAVVSEAIRRLGRIDVLVNNAGGSVVRPVVDMTEDDWDHVVDLNLKSVYLCSRAALPHMIERGSGRIVNIASNIAVTGGAGRASYAAAKGGVVAFTKSLALEVAEHAITVNAVAPGLTNTPRVRARLGSDRATADRTIPLGRIAEPADVAKAVVFFASEEAAYITGQTLHVNGGALLP